MKRRSFIYKSMLASSSLPLMISCASKKRRKKMVILGIDGLDPKIVQFLMQQGEMPHMQNLAKRGTFTMMRTTIPPQSPVAWGTFIVGADPGVHGIFDFVHRDPKTYFPKFSLTEHLEPKWVVHLGKYQLPIKAGKMVLQREGKPFWVNLQEHGIGATIFKVPSNFPPSPTKQNTLAGMGTPDILGTNGVYTLFTTDEEEYQKDLSPHRIYYADIDEKGVLDTRLEGPPNSLVKESENTSIPFSVYIDRIHHTIRIDIQDKEILLGEKEMSDWIEIKFPLLGPIQSIKGIVRFYLLELGKHFRLYISPIQINPIDPALPISTPETYSHQLAKKNGLFHTLGLPADFNAIKTGTFTIENYLIQSQSVFDESDHLWRAELARFLDSDQGLFFFYFSSLDQGQHIFRALNDQSHPFFHPKESKLFGQITVDYYRRCDRILGDSLKIIPPEVAVLVISDHGFAPFYKKVNLNTWLYHEGLLQLKNGESDESPSLALSADWGKTIAYGIGLNGLYLNLKGREAEGIVPPQNKHNMLIDLKKRLEAIRNPQNGEAIISCAYIADECFSKDFLERSPDIIVGFNSGYRSDDRFGEGGITSQFIADNLSWWSADHCIDPNKVPATFLSSFPIREEIPSMQDMAPTILDYFDIPIPKSMKGKALI